MSTLSTLTDSQPVVQCSQEYIQCPHCTYPKLLKGRRGLQIHLGKSHKLNNSINNPTSHASTSANSLNTPLSTTLSSYKKAFPVIKRIPRGARSAVAASLAKSIDECLSDNSASSWESLLLFAFNTLHVAKNNTRQSLTSKIKSNCSRSSSIDASCNDFHPKHYSRDVFKVVEGKVNDGDLKGAAQILFSSDTSAPDTPDTLATLQGKHPPAPAVLNYPDPPSSALPCLQASEDAVMASLMSFKNGSAGGLDGITPQHLKDLIVGVPGSRNNALLSSITRLVNFMLAGKVDTEIASTLYGANLCALGKKDGGVRPIAIGSTYRRLTSKVCCRYIVQDLEPKFKPTQLGFGSKGGCEAAVHACRTFLCNSKDQILLKVDVKNAFNSVSRVALLTEIQKEIPNLYPYLWQCYSSPSNLMYNNHSIFSAVGCQQGDPLGPAIFSLAIHPIISALKSKFNIWYLDDGSLGGESSCVLNDLSFLIRKFHEIGLDLNMSKCELYVSQENSNKTKIIDDFQSICPDIKVMSKNSLHLLGAPIFEESIPDFIDSQIIRFSENSDRLLKINSHMALSILRFCLFAPKFTYLMRCSPLWKFPVSCEKIDSILHSQIEKTLNIQLNDRQFLHASLPIRYGGLGIRQISSVVLPAFLSSVHSTISLIGKILAPSLRDIEVSCLTEAENAWKIACPGKDLPFCKGVQRTWDEPLCRQVHGWLLDSASSATEKARLLACSEKESGFWLHAYPSAHCATLLDNNSLRLAVGLRLGSNIVVPHRCPCGVEVDRLGHHGLSCQKSAGRFARHACLNDIIRRALASINIPAVLEPPGLARDDGKRPDGMTLIPWQVGRPLVWDATCVDTLAPSHLPTTSQRAGAAAASAEAAKRRKYTGLAGNHVFAAFGVETLGPWGPDAQKFYRDLKSRLFEHTADHRAGLFLGQRIGIAIQRGNVASLMGTLPQSADLGDYFVDNL